MNNDNDHTNITEADMPSMHEQLECRRTFVRRHVETPDVDEAWQKFAQEQPFSNSYSDDSQEKGTTRHIHSWWAAACVACILLVSGIVWIQLDRSTLQVCKAKEETKGITVSDNEGGNKTLAKAQDISFAQTAQKVRVIKNITVKTSRGKDCHLTLPDGTEVWLDAESAIQFPEVFVGKTRDVQLTGKAYFDVKHDKRHPFTVTSAYMQTIVYGTAFNMDVRDAATASVTLVRGCVAVREHPADQHLAILQPGQQATVGNLGVSVHDVDPYPYVQWREGFFYFDNQPLADIMRELGEWYNANVVFDDAELMHTRLHFAAERNSSLANIVASLNKMKSVVVTMKDNTVTVSKNND